MKHVFAILLIFFAGLYLTAQLTLERPKDDGVVRLRWSTDANPARKLQCDLFARSRVVLKEDEVLNWRGLGAALRPQSKADAPPVARQVQSLLPEPARQAMAAAAEGGLPDASRRAAIVAGLNEVLKAPTLCRQDSFAGLTVTRRAADLLARDRQTLSTTEVITLNRLLLEAAFPRIIRPTVLIEAAVDPTDRAKLVVQCATGVGPDIIDVYSQEQMTDYVSAGILVDVTDYAQRMGFGVQNTYPALAKCLTVGGRQYRYPCNVWASCIIYNKAIFDDHGVAYPKADWTWADFIETGKQLRNNPSKSGQKHIPLTNWYPLQFFQEMLISHGGCMFAPDGLTSALDSPPALATMRLYHDLMHVHQIVPPPAEAVAMSAQGGWGGGGLTWHWGGKAAMLAIGRWYAIQVPNYPALKGNLGTIVLPRAGARSTSLTDSRAAGINAKSPHWRESLYFLQYLASPEYGALIVKDGDSMPPNPALAASGQALVNPAVPDPAFHQPFVDAEANAQPIDQSPFIDAGIVQRWLQETIDKVENQTVGPEPGMKALATEINHQIRVNLERRPDLQRQFEQITGRPYTTDWWRNRKP